MKKVIKACPNIANDVPALADCSKIQKYKEYVNEHFKKAGLKQTIRNDLRFISYTLKKEKKLEFFILL